MTILSRSCFSTCKYPVGHLIKSYIGKYKKLFFSWDNNSKKVTCKTLYNYSFFKQTKIFSYHGSRFSYVTWPRQVIIKQDEGGDKTNWEATSARWREEGTLAHRQLSVPEGEKLRQILFLAEEQFGGKGESVTIIYARTVLCDEEWCPRKGEEVYGKILFAIWKHAHGEGFLPAAMKFGKFWIIEVLPFHT